MREVLRRHDQMREIEILVLDDDSRDHRESCSPHSPPLLPWHLRTERRIWWSLAGVLACMAVAGGPVAAWPTLVPLLIERGVFDGNEASFDAAFSLSMVCLLMTSLPAGLLYDRAGPRACGVGGSVLAAGGLAVMALAAARPATCSALLYLGYPAAMAGGATARRHGCCGSRGSLIRHGDHRDAFVSCV